uniref:Uncharacterized protein n=1 Tax=Oryza sativa subsp. japonica TaxID=39947 RepID=Q10LC1_ORYSJ|nr:hypothetical protein LOC_Os03g23250 [Oryza sativa Japonica Group]
MPEVVVVQQADEPGRRKGRPKERRRRRGWRGRRGDGVPAKPRSSRGGGRCCDVNGGDGDVGRRTGNATVAAGGVVVHLNNSQQYGATNQALIRSMKIDTPPSYSLIGVDMWPMEISETTINNGRNLFPDLPKGSNKQRFGRSRDTNRSGFLNAHALEPRNHSTTSPLVITHVETWMTSPRRLIPVCESKNTNKNKISIHLKNTPIRARVMSASDDTDEIVVEEFDEISRRLGSAYSGFVNYGGGVISSCSGGLPSMADLGISTSDLAMVAKLSTDGALPPEQTMAREEGVLPADVVTQRVKDVLISPASTAERLPTSLCDKPAADKAAAINVLPLTDVIGPLIDHQASASLKEKGGVGPRESPGLGRALLRDLGRSQAGLRKASANSAKSSDEVATSGTPVVTFPRVDVAPAAAESAEAVVVPVAVVPPSEPLDWSDMMAKCRRLFEKTSREVGAQMDCLTAHATASDGKVAQLETELEVARDDLQKMKEIVASNDVAFQNDSKIHPRNCAKNN